MEGIINIIKTLGPVRLVAMAGVVAILMGFFGYLIFRASQPVLVPLFTNLSLSDAEAIRNDLDSQGVTWSFNSDGTTVLVPKDQVLSLRMGFAAKQIPSGGTVGYEIFDNASLFGTTSLVQNINKTRALEGELARTIQSIKRVRSARVHLVIPDRPIFSQEQIEATASVIVNLTADLEGSQVRAIQQLVASSVPTMKSGAVSVIDADGRLLGGGMADSSNQFAADALQERSTLAENNIRRQIEEIIGSIVGPGRVRARVAIEYDYNRVTEQSELFDPDSQVVRSSQTSEDVSASKDPISDNTVSTSTELPLANQNAEQSGANRTDNSNSTQETVNYEISKTLKTEIKEAGQIKRISAAVLVDGNYSQDAAGGLSYQPRTQEEIDQLIRLTKTAIGFSKERGDQVEVINMRFATLPVTTLSDATQSVGFDFNSLLEFTKEDIYRAMEMLVTLILGIFVLLLAVRPLVKRALTPDTPKLEKPGSENASVSQNATEERNSANEGGQPDNPLNDQLRETMMLNSKNEVIINKIGEVVEKSPAEAATVIRRWMEDGSSERAA